MPNENSPAGMNTLRRGKTIEQIYQKKTQLEHILLRPDTYVGSTEHQLQDMWVYDEGADQMVHRKIDYVPALYKIFDEILVNAADNAMRDKKMDLIDVTIDRQQGSISVMNNGSGIPVQIHKEHRCYVPELIFGHLLTSDNYDDNEKKVTGGRNGYGAKLTNVFSKRFVIETADRSTKKKFSQVYEQNMSKKHDPTITEFSGSEYTRVTFWPDFPRFGMNGLDPDIAALMAKRVYDIAGSSDKRVRVILNGKPLPVKCFQDYIGFYIKGGSNQAEGGSPIVHEHCGDRWEVAVSLTDGTFNQVSFVNSINTIKGGTHVAHVSDQVVEAILKVVKGKNRGGIDIKPAHVRNHLFVFINCLIENPAFDSQTKETLTTKQGKFGSTCELSDKFMKQVMKSGVVEMILDWVKLKQKVDMGRQLRAATKTTGRVMGIPKLEDANDAGGRNSQDCTLILTEGDSAKSLAVAGLSVVGRDKYGVFPLKGKVLNVRDANYKQVTGNAEIQNLLKIMGLDIKCEYTSTQKLRYGSIMLMTDQDHDGSHIKGLLINLIHYWWPSLVKMKGFLKEFTTPIVKVWKEGKSSDGERKEERCFFTINEYEEWKASNNGGKGWKMKYYKGLGTSTMKEAKEYFRDVDRHELSFNWRNDNDGESIDLAFNKKRADDRKDWINGYEEGTYVDHSKSQVCYTDFIHKELVQFAKYDVQRSVPSMVDGFKPSQRKVIFCAFKKKIKTDIKVAQFVGYISEHSAYHHGETSLENTIVNLAQNFVGSNNVNLLFPSGQFGTRLQGGKDHAAARYIYTRLQGVTRTIFHADDDPILQYLNEEGLYIEPKWYCPVLPAVLINGADGIGVGWSTFIPNYNPRDIIRNMRRMLRGLDMEDMPPWYKGYKGTIVPNEKEGGRWEVTGCIRKTNDTTLEITELPLKTWTQNYKEFLEEMMPAEGKKANDDESKHTIEDFREYHTESSVHFVLTLTPDKLRQVEKAGLEKTFKLKSSIATTNMVLFDEEGKIAKYQTSLDILRDFCKVRRAVYERRKAYLVAKLNKEKEILSNKARFILMVVKGELELRKKKRADLLAELKKLNFTPMSKLNALMKGKTDAGFQGGDAAAAKAAAAADLAEDGDEGEADSGAAASTNKSEYDYLLGMNLWSLTFEKVEEIKKLLEAKKEELDALIATSIEQIWDRDLEAISKALDELDEREAQEAAASASIAQGGAKKKRGGGRAPPPPVPTPSAAPASKKRAADDPALKAPLQALRADSDVFNIQKNIRTRAPPPPAPTALSADDAVQIDEPASKPERGAEKAPAAKRARATPATASAQPAVPAAPALPAAAPPPQEAASSEYLPFGSSVGSGSSLLSRLLTKTGSQPSTTTVATHNHVPFATRDSSDDLLLNLIPKFDLDPPTVTLDPEPEPSKGGARRTNPGRAPLRPTAASSSTLGLGLGSASSGFNAAPPSAAPRGLAGAMSASLAVGAGGSAAAKPPPRKRQRRAAVVDDDGIDD